jgi:integrase
MATLAPFCPTTIADAVEAFEAFLVRRRRSPLTIDRYRPVLRDFMEWAGNRTPGSITTVELDEGFLAEWERAFVERNGRAPSDNTVRNVIGVLTSFYGYLNDFGFIVDEDGRSLANPTLALETPRIETGPPDWLRADQDAKLLSASMNEQEQILIWLLRMTGMRVGEALALKWSDVDLDEGSITIESGKFGKSRVVPILPELRPRLTRWAQHLKVRDLYDPRGLVLVTRNRTSWVPQPGSTDSWAVVRPVRFAE